MNPLLLPALHLLHEASQAVLATHSQSLPGFPFATAVPLLVDDAQCPLLLISALAEHTRNLQADSRASLSVSEAAASNIQNAARLTLVGHFEPYTPSPEIEAKLLRHQPDAAQYLNLDFTYYRLRLHRARYIGGVGHMGWLEPEDWAALPHISATDEARLLASVADQVPAQSKLLALDPYGLDYKTKNLKRRLRFTSPLDSASLDRELPKMLQALN